jgi:hypothetical protein
LTWQPISPSALEELVSRELGDCPGDQQRFFAQVRIAPAKWQLPPWGDDGGGFWAVAVYGNRVLWYNDIEDGFNVSTFVVPGEIPQGEYWCNQDELRWALPRLQGDLGIRLGAPMPVSSA